MVEGTLVPSSTSGCYAIDHAEGFEITGGQQCEILLAGNWIPGKVEQSSESVGNYHIARGNAVGLFHGYYFTVGDGSGGTRCV
jgi:uncharacterized protein DUF5348